MIKVNELRVGNQIYGADDKNVITVDVQELVLLQRQPNLAMPIPLTPEILETCGFISSDDKDWFAIKGPKGNLAITMHHDTVRFYFGHPEQIDCRHLHQLQNLYFARTGDELIYKP